MGALGSEEPFTYLEFHLDDTLAEAVVRHRWCEGTAGGHEAAGPVCHDGPRMEWNLSPRANGWKLSR